MIQNNTTTKGKRQLEPTWQIQAWLLNHLSYGGSYQSYEGDEVNAVSAVLAEKELITQDNYNLTITDKGKRWLARECEIRQLEAKVEQRQEWKRAICEVGLVYGRDVKSLAKEINADIYEVKQRIKNLEAKR